MKPRMQAARLQCLKLQVDASPDPQTRAFTGTELSRKNSVTQDTEKTNGTEADEAENLSSTRMSRARILIFVCSFCAD